MKTRHILFLALVALSIASCVQPKPEHQIESVSEFMDSLNNGGAGLYYTINCYKDSSSYNYWYSSCFVDSFKKEVKEFLFLEKKTTRFLDRICENAADSYRYCSNDSVDYSITIKKEPKELLTFHRYRNRDGEVFSLFHTTKKAVKSFSDPFNPKPVRALLQKFLSEQKDVEKFDVCYEWDEGVPFPPFKSGSPDNLMTRWQGHGTDSLAATKITGTMYRIPLQKGSVNAVSADLSERMIHLISEKPICGARLQAYVQPGAKPEERIHQLQSFMIIDWNTRVCAYQIEVGRREKELLILELNSPNAQRFAIPINWWGIMRIHNDKFFYRTDSEHALPPGECSNK